MTVKYAFDAFFEARLTPASPNIAKICTKSLYFDRNSCVPSLRKGVFELLEEIKFYWFLQARLTLTLLKTCFVRKIPDFAEFVSGTRACLACRNASGF